MVYMDNVIYILMFIPSVIIIEKYGLKLSMILAVALSVVGAWISLAVSNEAV